MSTTNLIFIGSLEEVTGFSALGLRTEVANNTEEVRNKLQTLSQTEKNSLIFIFERHAKDLQAEIRKLNKKLNIVVIPDAKGSLHLGEQMLQTVIEKAIGSQLFSNKGENS